MNIGILLPNWVGDLTMATPMLRALHQQYSDCRLIGVMKPHLIGVLEDAPWLSESIPCVHQRWKGTNGFFETTRRLRERDLDIIISLRATLRGALMVRASGAGLKLGLHTKSFARFYHMTSDEAHRDTSGVRSVVDRYLDLASLMNCDVENRRLELFFTDEHRSLVDEFLTQNATLDPNRLVIMNSGAAGGKNRHWPVERFRAVARQLVDAYGYSVIVNCGPAERDDARKIAESVNRPEVVSLADAPDLSFGFLKALLSRASVLVTTDSGPRHVAAAVGTPVVAILGPIDPRTTHNYNPNELIAQSSGLDCQPCNSNRCRLESVKCMDQISVSQVVQTTIRAMNREKYLPIAV